MQKGLALLIVGAMLTLAVSVGLAAGPTVDGPVTQKFTYEGDDFYSRIAVNCTHRASRFDRAPPSGPSH